MKKKLEAELISIAHRILKLNNRAELDQLQQETLKLYEKISVLRFVEDNFSDVQPTIRHASAWDTLEEIYGLEEPVHVHANEVEAKEAAAKAEKQAEKEHGKEAEADKKEAPAEDKANESGKGVTADKGQAPVAKEEKEETEEEDQAEPKPEDAEEEPAVEEAEEKEEVKEDAPEAEAKEEKKLEEPKTEAKEKEKDEEKEEEPTVKVEVEKPAEEIKAMEEAAVAVFEKEEDSTIEEEEKATDAEVVTIEPDAKTKVEDSGLSFDFAFERPAAPEEPSKQKEITFEDYKDYKEPEFIKKEDAGAAPKAEQPQEPVVKDWRDWEPSTSGNAEPAKEELKAEPVAEQPKPEAVKEEPKQESTVRGNIATRSDFERPKSLNDTLGKSITVGLNDRIAFEKNLFSGSTDDLNRVLSQLNTINTYDEARDFIKNLVKPDYNNWEGKEEYEERFMAIVEKKFN